MKWSDIHRHVPPNNPIKQRFSINTNIHGPFGPEQQGTASSKDPTPKVATRHDALLSLRPFGLSSSKTGVREFHSLRPTLLGWHCTLCARTIYDRQWDSRSVAAFRSGGTDRLATINTTISNYCPSNILHCANSRRSFFEVPREPAGYSLFKLAPRAQQRRGPYEDLCCLIPYSSLYSGLMVMMMAMRRMHSATKMAV